MSWLFGYNKKQPPDFANLAGITPGIGDGSGGGGGDELPRDKSKMEAYRFDSGALERAAAAARELEKSSKKSNSKEMFLMDRPK